MSWSAQVYVKWNNKCPASKGWGWLKEWKEVKSAWSTMGEWDMILWVDAKTPDDLEHFVVNKLRSQDWVENTQTCWTHEVWSRAS